VKEWSKRLRYISHFDPKIPQKIVDVNRSGNGLTKDVALLSLSALVKNVTYSPGLAKRRLREGSCPREGVAPSLFINKDSNV